MFDEQIRQSFAAQGAAMADQFNKRAEEDYVQACRNWAENQNSGKAKKGDKAPVAPIKVKAVVAFEPKFSLEFAETAEPVSTVAPDAFLAKFGTDIGAIGGPVGGLIPGTTDQYYLSSAAASPRVNDRWTSPAGDVYIWHQPTPFGGYWKREA